MNIQQTSLFKTKDLGEIAYLMMNNVKVVKEHVYDRKTILFFDNTDKKSTKLIDDYYQNGYFTYFKSMSNARNYLFSKLNQEIK